VRQRGSLTRENIEKMTLSEFKIGESTFCPPYKIEGEPSSRGELDADVFVSDEAFDRLAKILPSNLRSTIDAIMPRTRNGGSYTVRLGTRWLANGLEAAEFNRSVFGER
jgi:hypothetical protein